MLLFGLHSGVVAIVVGWSRIMVYVRRLVCIFSDRSCRVYEALMHPKVFRIASGYEVVKGYVTFPSGLVVDVEPGETIEVYVALTGRRGARVGMHTYAELVPEKPPQGLLVGD